MKWPWEKSFSDLSERMDQIEENVKLDFEKSSKDIKNFSDAVGENVESIVKGMGSMKRLSSQFQSNFSQIHEALESISKRVRDIEMQSSPDAVGESVERQEALLPKAAKTKHSLRQYGIVMYCLLSPLVAAAAVYLVMS